MNCYILFLMLRNVFITIVNHHSLDGHVKEKFKM